MHLFVVICVIVYYAMQFDIVQKSEVAELFFVIIVILRQGH